MIVLEYTRSLGSRDYVRPTDKLWVGIGEGGGGIQISIIIIYRYQRTGQTQGGICRGKGGFSPSLLHDIPGTGWSLAIPGRDTIYPMHIIYVSNYPRPPLYMHLNYHESRW